ncbi:uncharacterized protein LOC133740111 [Rosa rugosa]|uniref:uncharacterized protein LOC133740111 n=1 Tax=Rosa rugosa TaxID=74645 RepID=UPI002B4165AB|nr:uncharacterized protein LOC133740111 [Rosa rugosa]XP_062023970.1 uncharacterized protein LOC133740111 [Rosa rugosa]XP_062023971.1 uncharacterized protein LOC133740111 [Rosa rugosa]XP_062023973.1 uncharacterized protein LOC133740111 [Rosa rugosa]XP_062023974.1 uncharacterized protein LOC133740111 [Rosa rugosa]XP_062023975.1 uncharacterized protein LOC133740111 [Rosa rugosa]XP_062023976.1 uncharacterized protein LOC133740111 [Rosa rugosa]
MDGGDGGTGFTCNICFESADKDPIVTPCGHLYCKSCIYTWLRNPRHDSKRCPCPVCNAIIEDSKLIPLYGIGKSQDLNQKSRPIPVASVESPERQAGQKSATTSAPYRPTPSAPEWPTGPRPATPSAPEWPTDPTPTPSAPEWPTGPRPATPSAPIWTDPRPATPSVRNCSSDQTLATPSTANVILNQVCRLLIRVGQYMLVRIIEVATDKLIEAVERKINESSEAAEERNGVNEEGSGNNIVSSEEVEVTDSNGEGSHLGPWVVLNPT